MLGEIIAVGEEVLAGDVINSNAATLSRKLSEIGVFCRFHSVVGDIVGDITKQLELAVNRSKVIVLCGGLGPTKDDLTKEAVASFLNKELYADEKLMEGIKAWFVGRNYTPTKNNFKQGLMIDGGEALINNNGTAPGIYVKHNECHLFLLPGPPGELLPMLENCVIPVIRPLVKSKIVSKTFKLINIGESNAVTILDDIMEASEDFILAPYAKLREVHLKATAIGNDILVLNAKIKRVEDIIYERLGEYIYSDNAMDIVDIVIHKFKDKGMTLATAESCTGGLIGSMIVKKPGASVVYTQGFITYSNESKIKLLGVSKDIITKYGAVSEPCAREMVKGLLAKSGADYGISVTGIAGPDGGTSEKPVGLVYIGIGTSDGVRVYEHYFKGNREKIRIQSAKVAMTHLWSILR